LESNGIGMLARIIARQITVRIMAWCAWYNRRARNIAGGISWRAYLSGARHRGGISNAGIVSIGNIENIK